MQTRFSRKDSTTTLPTNAEATSQVEEVHYVAGREKCVIALLHTGHACRPPTVKKTMTPGHQKSSNLRTFLRIGSRLHTNIGCTTHCNTT